MIKKESFVFRIAPSHIDRVEEALKKDELIIGWSKVKGLLNEKLSREKFRQIIHDTYDSYKKEYKGYRGSGSGAGNMWRFIREMQIGSHVIVPHGEELYTAKVTDTAYYDETKVKEDTAYRRPVKWLNNKNPILRSTIKSKIKSQLTCVRAPHGLIEEILNIYAKGSKKNNSEYIDLKINPSKMKSSSKEGKSNIGAIDFEKENKRYERLGKQGELVVLQKEKEILIKNKRKDLAKKVKLISRDNPSAGYDILSYEKDGDKKYIEVKSTSRAPSKTANFFMTINEYNKAKKIKNYNLYIVFGVESKNPKIWQIKNPLQHKGKGLYFTPISFRVTVNIK